MQSVRSDIRRSVLHRSFMLVWLLLLLSRPSVLAQTVANGDFELGRGQGWTEYSSGGYAVIGTGPFFASTEISPAVTPRSGSRMARLGGFSYEENAIGQAVTLPNSSPLYLRFFAQTRSASTSECNGLWVGATVYIIINGQKIDSSYLCQYNDLHQWTMFYIDVSSLAGQSMTLVFRAEAANSVWSYLYLDDITVSTSTDVRGDLAGTVPAAFQLEQNHPNPFNPSTTIRYQLESASQVRLTVANMLGQEVRALVNAVEEPGEKTVHFDAGGLPSGIYYYRLDAASVSDPAKRFSQTRKMMLVK